MITPLRDADGDFDGELLVQKNKKAAYLKVWPI